MYRSCQHPSRRHDFLSKGGIRQKRQCTNGPVVPAMSEVLPAVCIWKPFFTTAERKLLGVLLNGMKGGQRSDTITGVSI